jgi:hypothetical protein
MRNGFAYRCADPWWPDRWLTLLCFGPDHADLLFVETAWTVAFPIFLA